MNNIKSRFLVEDKRRNRGKDYRVSVGMTGNAIALAISVLVAMFDVPEAHAAAVVMGAMALANMVRRWYSRGGEVKAKVET